MDGTVLIADDDRSIRTVLTQALTRAGCRVHATGSLQQLLKWAEEGRGDLVVTDVMMPDGNGIDMIPAIRRARPDLPVIVISAQNTIVTAIRAAESDAFEYLPKPFDLPDLLAKSREALGRRGRLSDSPPVAEPPPQGAAGMPLIGHAPAMQALFRLVARVLNADLPVMVTGEAGTGKTMVARSLHELSERRAAPLSVLTPADGSSDAIASAVRQGRGGSLLIENPAGFDPAAQLRLLAVIEAAGEGAPRLISTTGPDPQAGTGPGALRADLFYRLAGVTIEVPPLAARLDDLPVLAAHLLARASAQGLAERSLSDAALSVLRAHPFPGNVRELENLMRRLAVTGSGEVSEAEMRAALEPGQDRQPIHSAPPQGRLSDAVAVHLSRYFDLHGDDLPPPGLYDRILREIEIPLLEIALDATGGNQLRCAELLGINRNTLRKKLTDLNIQVTRRRKLM